MTSRVVIDHSAAFNQGAGIGRYARNIVPELARTLDDVNFTLWYAPEPDFGARFSHEALALLAGNKRVRTRACRWDRRRMDQIWFRARMPVPIEVWTGPSDLIYSPDFTAPPSLRSPSIVTIHDLAFQIVPDRAPKALRDYLSSVVPRQIRKAEAIVAVSETTKLDMMERLGVDSERITIVPNAVDRRFFDAPSLTLTERSVLGVPERYLLTVGTIEPRKNHLTLFKALERIPASMQLPLVVVGRIGWASDDIVAAARHLGEKGRVILLDYVDDRILPALYASADALIYPSWYEGFGLPVLEGMASGTRVIASDVPAHREISGRTVILVAPDDIDELADAIERASTTADDPSMRARRTRRASEYSWETSGAILANLVRRVLIS